jgi:hypothetical protein
MTIETLGEIRAKYNFWNAEERPYYEALSEAIRVLKAQKDNGNYAKIVRCGECKHYNAGFECLAEGYGIERDPDWFCAGGERKVQDG